MLARLDLVAQCTKVLALAIDGLFFDDIPGPREQLFIELHVIVFFRIEAGVSRLKLVVYNILLLLIDLDDLVVELSLHIQISVNMLLLLL